MSEFPDFPAFEPLFTAYAPVPLYLELLNLNRGSEDATALLRKLLAENSDLTPQIIALLDESNWRPQLVGASAIGLGSANEPSLTALWRAFDSGSRVSPQLAAIALITQARHCRHWLIFASACRNIRG